MRQGLSQSGFILFSRDDFFVQEFCQHDVSPLGRRIDAAIRRESVRRPNQPSQESRFSYGEVGELFGKIKLRSFVNPENPLRAFLTQIDFVQIVLENFIFGISSFRNERHHRFLDLATERALVVKEKIFHQLLRQRASALHHAGASNVDPNSAQYRDRVDPVMAIKTLIFDGQNRFDD